MTREVDLGGRSRENETSTNNPFFDKDLISAKELTPEKLNWLFQFVPLMETIHLNSTPCNLLEGKIAVPIFFQPSSRTKLSHQTAMMQLGGKVNSVEDPDRYSSFAKGANFRDEILTYALMGDLLVIRQPKVGLSQEAADYSHVPVINAGDGNGEHPTQALLDVLTIWRRFGRLDNLTVVLGGDLANGRTVHSLVRLLANFENNRLILISPQELDLPVQLIQFLRERNLEVSQYDNFTEEMKKADVWYWTRVQKEQFINNALAKLIENLESRGYQITKGFLDKAYPLAAAMAEEDYGRVCDWGIIDADVLRQYAKDEMILMHPFPRVNEIALEVDEDSRAVYLHQQMRNGIYIRMALIAAILTNNLNKEAIIDSIPSKFQQQLLKTIEITPAVI